MSKTHVAMGHEECPVCGSTHTESVLLDKRLRSVFPEHEKVVTGLSLCPECAIHKPEYLTMIETTGDPTKDREAERTGRVARVRWEVATELFTDLSDSLRVTGFVFIDEPSMTYLHNQAEGSHATH